MPTAEDAEGPRSESSVPVWRQGLGWAFRSAEARVLGFFLVWRFLLQIPYAAASAWRGPLSVHGDLVTYGESLPGWLVHWFQWDAGWFLHTVHLGYGLEPVKGESLTVAFFPLYPLSIRTLSAITGLQPSIMGFALSHLFAAAFCVVLYRFAARQTDPETGKRVVLYLLLFPGSFFLVSMYSESLLLLTSVAALASADERHWWRAAGFAALATATKSTGVLLLPVLAIMLLRARPRPSWWSSAALVLSPAGLVAYSAYLWLRLGDPLLWSTAQDAWRRQIAPNFLDRIIAYHVEVFSAGGIGHDRFVAVFDAVLLLSIVAGGIALALSGRYALALMALLAVIGPLLTGATFSMSRYGLMAFPVFLWLATRLRRGSFADLSYRALSTSLLATAIFVFVSGEWIG